MLHKHLLHLGHFYPHSKCLTAIYGPYVPKFILWMYGMEYFSDIWENMISAAQWLKIHFIALYTSTKISTKKQELNGLIIIIFFFMYLMLKTHIEWKRNKMC